VTRAIIVGAGLGGLALGIRLQSAGVATTIVEAQDRPGGHARPRTQDGFTFDAAPAGITDPAALAELWRLAGEDMARDVELMPVRPFRRFNWRDGTSFDLSNDDAQLRAEIARLDTHDIAGYERFLEYAANVCRDGYEKVAATAFLDFGSMVALAPTLVRYQAWRSVYSIVSGFVRHEKLRQVLSFHTMTIGGNPTTTSAVHAALHKLERDGGAWWPRGGGHRLAAGMAALFERLGGTLRLGDPVRRIETLGDHATGVVAASGWQAEAEAIVSNADVLHSYRDLLAGSRSAKRTAARLVNRKWSPSLFAVDFAVKGSWPGIPHRMVLFGPRYREWLTDIFDHGVLAEDFALYLDHPTVTDPGIAPEGHSLFRATVPVPHLGKFPVDWAQVGPILERRILDEIGRRLIPDIHARIVAKATHSPSDIARDLNAHLGSAFGLEPSLAQTAWFRVHNRDPHIPNLYFVGAGTHPGAGIPGVLASAKATAALMLEQK